MSLDTAGDMELLFSVGVACTLAPMDPGFAYGLGPLVSSSYRKESANHAIDILQLDWLHCGLEKHVLPHIYLCLAENRHYRLASRIQINRTNAKGGPRKGAG